MDNQRLAEQIIRTMYAEDPFSQWLGIEIGAIAPGHCELHLTVRADMLNGFGMAHGGITYSLADSALAFASNSRGRKAVSIETAISHLDPLVTGDRLTARASEEHLHTRIGLYRVEVTNQEDRLVALFKGTVYRRKEQWEV